MGEPISSIPKLRFDSDRRFGVELEVLAFDRKNRPEGGEKDKPKGTDYIISLVKKHTDENVEWRTYEHTNNNDCWVVKPDASCGLEICTPIYRPWRGIKKTCQVVEAFSKDDNVAVDHRCSVHIHIDVSDLREEQVASVIIHWIKCEAMFLDMVPESRKSNRYCQFMCARENFDTEVYLSPSQIISAIADVKYYTANTHQWKRSEGKRKTLEFRVIEGEGCVDPYLIKNWIRLIIHFVEITSRYPLPHPYVAGDQWSWICMLDTMDFMKVLGFYPGQFELSNGLKQTRNWLLSRLCRYMHNDVDYGPRWKAYKELKDLISKLSSYGEVIDVESNLNPPNMSDAIYNEDYRF